MKPKTQIFKLNERDDLNLEIIVTKLGLTKQDFLEKLVKTEIAKGLGELKAQYAPEGSKLPQKTIKST
ncbi:MAG TPA: hypothetical protein PLS91_01330 [Candidatus Paceibacterota bacterium]|jgi:hypothetical protein|nr:hypothetical protein [Candidatus Paceibacterota bacterium]